VVVVIVDGLNPELPVLKAYLDPVRDSSRGFVFVVSKRDLLGDEEAARLAHEMKEWMGEEPWFVSSPSIFGIREVAQKMAEIAEARLSRQPGEVILTQIEHVRAVERAIETLSRARSAMDLVLFATDLRHAMNELGPLIGETVPDDVLGKIFSDFCIGK
jgi:tRNA modification GTPase